MPQKRLSMRKIREVLRLRWQCCLSHRQIATSCQTGVGTVQEYLRRANAAGLSWPLPDSLTDSQLEELLFPALSASTTGTRPLPDWTRLHKELRRKDVTLVLLWEEYRAEYPQGYGYSRFCELYQQWQKKLDPRMRQVHKAGEKLFVDYAGSTLPVVDRTTGEVHQAQIFVATLGASSYIYAEATLSQSLPDWISSHVRAFAFFGGVPRLLIPDNLKTGITSACYYEPDVNPSYLEMARHYGCVVIPARVRKPRDKAKVENGVQQVERRLLAPLRHHTFFSLAELNRQLGLLRDALNDRPSQYLPETRTELFESLDKPALLPLPQETYQLALWQKARVQVDYHIQVERHFYSVPYHLLRQEVEVRITEAIVEVFYEGKRVASHLRSAKQHAATTLEEHMPPGHRAIKERNASALLLQAEQVGVSTQQAMECILATREHPEQAYRCCLGVLRLARVFGAQPLEAACQIALARNTLSYRAIQQILKDPSFKAQPAPVAHSNIRGAEYYHGTGKEESSC